MTRTFLLALALFLPTLGTLPALAFETRAGAAWVKDLATDTVILEKNSDESLPPASMSKLMTLNMLFEALRDGRVTMETRFSVSSRARAMGGSSMFLDERDRPTVEELIRGIVVQSGNDATVVVAEGLGGTEEEFSRQMTERAHALGMTSTNLTNASGWPHPAHRMSMRDLGIITTRLVTAFPEYYPYFAETEWEFDGRAPQNRFNRNPLLTAGLGADGLKTGHTREAGYGLAGSAVQGDRRIVFVITGLETERERVEEAERIVNWAFRQFVKRTVAVGGRPIAQAEVWMGAAPRVGLAPAEDTVLLLPALSQDRVSAQVIYDEPVVAPVAEGQQVGTLVIAVPDMPERRIPLLAIGSVPPGGFAIRLRTAALHLLRQAVGERISF